MVASRLRCKKVLLRLVCSLLGISACSGMAEARPVCPRIVSLAPSITETVYALGLESQVSAVSRFDTYPPAVKSKPRVGGLYDVNLESLVRLAAKPVILLNEHHSTRQQIERMGLTTLTVDHRSIAGIIESFRQIGIFCKVPDWQRTHDFLRDRLDHWQDFFQKYETVSALVILGGGVRSGSAQSFYVSGQDGFYAEALAITGGKNIHTGPTGLLPAVALESIRDANPEVVIEILPPGNARDPSPSFKVLAELFPDLQAVKDNRLHTISADYSVIPGPRFPLLLKDLAAILHPDLNRADMPPFPVPDPA